MPLLAARSQELQEMIDEADRDGDGEVNEAASVGVGERVVL